MMFNLKQILEAVKGEGYNLFDDVKINRIVTDSRKIDKGDCFVALIGEKFDGHDFLEEVYNKGASLAIVSKLNTKISIPQILVSDTLKAYKDIALSHRKKFDIPVIAVTGSSGKTSTKEMISSTLAEKFIVHKTQKNFNNEIGLPFTVLQLDESHEVAVLEMGMNHFGEIESLAYVARPHIAVITNIGTAHIENLGSRENILKAKMEIVSYFENNDILIVNGDNDLLSKVESDKYKVIKFAIENEADYRAYDVVDLKEEGIEFKCKVRNKEKLFKVNTPGMHNVYNALAAIAVADILGLNYKEMFDGILNFNPGNMRMNIVEKNGVKFIVDCYNANPESMKVAIDVLNKFEGRKIAVLGDMFELGDYAEKFHREVGKYLIDKIDVLIAVGDYSKYYFDEAKDSIEAYYFDNKIDALEYLKNFIKDGDVLLFKASRGMKLEEILDSLIEQRK